MKEIDRTREIFSLSELKPSECGVVVDVLNREELERLQAMGVCMGRRVEVVKSGDPLILRVFGSRIGLSARLAEHVKVERCPGAPRCWEVTP